MPCRFPGPHSGGRLRGLVGGGISRPTPGGGVSQHALRQSPLLLTATAAGGTHPTGMHSCFLKIFMKVLNKFQHFKIQGVILVRLVIIWSLGAYIVC